MSLLENFQIEEFVDTIDDKISLLTEDERQILKSLYGRLSSGDPRTWVDIGVGYLYNQRRILNEC